MPGQTRINIAINHLPFELAARNCASRYCKEVEHNSIPAAAVAPKPIYTSAAVGVVGLSVPVNDPGLQFMIPAVDIVPCVEMLPVDPDSPICPVQVLPDSDPLDKPF